MTPEQQAAFIIAQSATAMIQAMGLKARNDQDAIRGLYPSNGEDDFLRVIEGNGISHNQVIGLFTNR